DWYSTPFRKYDPSLGRFHGVDALAELNITVGPSSFAHNNPISFNDPTGLDDNDGDEENGGGGGGVPPIPMQGPWYGYDMRGYDNIAKATQGHGGNNGWASSRSSGSLYYNAFGSYSPNAIQHASIVAAKDMWKKGVQGFANAILSGMGDNGWLTLVGSDFQTVYDAWAAGMDFDLESTGGDGVNMSIYNLIVASSRSSGIVEIRLSNNSNSDQDWIFKDDQGRQLFDYWRNGNGAELILNTNEWGAYMASNWFLTDQIGRHLANTDAVNRTSNGAISGSFHADLDLGDSYTTGYGLLGGSNFNVGDLMYSGTVEVLGNGSFQYNIKLVWNDIMDPNRQYLGDRIGAWLYPGTNYIVRIHWSISTKITLPK
ncbi:MAG: hypothetical protein ABJF11_03305, partial [Reichenbachiella sp.]